MNIPTKTIDVCREHLMSDKSEMIRIGIPDNVIDRVMRIRDVYNRWNKSPTLRKRQIVDLLMGTYNISESSAYSDIKIIENLLGDFNETTKSYHRWYFNEMIRDAVDMAHKKKDLKNLIQALDKYAKYNRLDEEDVRSIDWDEINVQPFDISSDPTIIGIKPITNLPEHISRLKKKYKGDRIEDVTHEEVDLKEGLEDE